MKKLIVVFVLLFTLVVPSMAQARGFSGGHSSTFSSHSSSTRSSSTYHSGYKSPFSSVSRSKYKGTQSSKRSSFWSHAAAFGAGTFLGSMFHPFGGFGNPFNFSMIGFLLDILIIFIIIRVIKGIFTRRRY